MKFTGKTILITGASSGLGKAFALRIAADKPHIILAARRVEKLKEVAAECNKQGASTNIVELDVANPEAIKQVFANLAGSGKSLDLVFNNAGIGYVEPIYSMTPEKVQEMSDVNVRAMLLVTKYAADIMVQQKSGHIIITSSVAGILPTPNWGVYSASKAAVISFADCIRPELSPFGVQVTTLYPGAVKTEFFEAQKANLALDKSPFAIGADKVARLLYRASFTRTDRLHVPTYIWAVNLLYRLFPAVLRFLVAKTGVSQ